MLAEVKKIFQKMFFFEITLCRLILTFKSNYQLNAYQRFTQINKCLRFLIYIYKKKHNLSFSFVSSDIYVVNRGNNCH